MIECSKLIELAEGIVFSALIKLVEWNWASNILLTVFDLSDLGLLRTISSLLLRTLSSLSRLCRLAMN